MNEKQFFILNEMKRKDEEGSHTHSLNMMDPSSDMAEAEDTAEANNKNINQTSEAFEKITFNE